MTKKILILTIFCFLFVQKIHSQKNNTSLVKEIKIGLLISDNKSIEAKNAAQLAIDKANKVFKSKGIHFQLVVKSMEGPWGTGSKQAVDLIFKDKVWAILGSHKGQNAHLVEQVIAKMHTVFINSWATDVTLSQAFVPWYFSCVPNDKQQANLLIKDIYKKNVNAKVAVIADKSYDSKSAVNTFLNQVKLKGKSMPLQLFFETADSENKTLINSLKKANINNVILFCKPHLALKFMAQMPLKNREQNFYGTLSIMGENKKSVVKGSPNTNLAFINFQKDYQNKYGKIPSVKAAYSYDGVGILIEAIRKSGFNRDKIQKTMLNTDYQGITGSVKFDNKGNRISNTGFIEISKSFLASVIK